MRLTNLVDMIVKLTRPLVLWTLLAVVGYLAVFGDNKEAQAILFGQFATLAGATWGERSALKSKDEERQTSG